MEQSAVIDRFEGRFIILKLADGQELRWPIERLDPGLREGSVLRLKISADATEEVERERIARALLTEILGGGRTQ